MKRPTVSVVMPIHVKPEPVLRRVLRSLARQGQEETIVVLDRTPVELSELVVDELRVLGRGLFGEVTIIRRDGPPGWQSFAAAANLGLRAVRCDLVYFLQSDVKQASGNIERARELLAEADPVLFGRVVESDPKAAALDPLTLPTICDSYAPRPLSFTMALRRAYGDRLGWYDEAFMAGHGLEDLDLAWRLWDGGAHFLFLDSVSGEHQTHEHGFWDPRLHEINRQIFIRKWGFEERDWCPGARMSRPEPGMMVWVNPEHSRLAARREVA